MLDALIRRIVTSPLDPLADALTRAKIGANAVTVGGCAMGLLAAAFIADEAFVPGIVFLALNRLADILDGMVARRTRTTSLGAFLDASLDLFVYAAIPFAFALAHQQDALAATFLLMGLMIAAVPEAIMRALMRDEGEQPLLTFSGHSETFIVFVLICMAPRWAFSLLAYFFGVLFFFSAGLVIASAATHLRAPAKP